ncbi:MAG: hypothetical protein KJ941_13400 [Bacteroidetes bacterium]|nr:hypothetical protein [Bacteroidota bacterium]
MLMEGFSLVQKEEIADFHFPTEEVLKKKLELKEREGSLDRAIALGNLEHQKVRIYFSDEQGPKVVETTIWGITDKAILLKKNVLLPKHRILKLEI